MSGTLAFVLAASCSYTLETAGAAPPQPGQPGFVAPTQQAVREAVQRSLVLLEKSRSEYLESRRCFSCHHQAIPGLALTLAQARGFTIDDKSLRTQVELTVKNLRDREALYRKGTGPGGQVDNAASALWTLEMVGWKADSTTTAVVDYLLQRDANLDHWRTVSHRPPSEASHFTATYLALRGLRAFAQPSNTKESHLDQKALSAQRAEKALVWLLRTKARDTEDRVFRLGALKYAGATVEQIASAARELRQSQREDGGWGQTAELASDVYATGTALVMLHQVGDLSTEDQVYQRGLRFLIEKQLQDGSWHVRSRSRPFQTYFESGFPHGKDQFISITASSWATAALIFGCDIQQIPKYKKM